MRMDSNPKSIGIIFDALHEINADLDRFNRMDKIVDALTSISESLAVITGKEAWTERKIE